MNFDNSNNSYNSINQRHNNASFKRTQIKTVDSKNITSEQKRIVFEREKLEKLMLEKIEEVDKKEADSRKNLKIGEPIFASVIGSDILTNFDYIRYCEVRDPEEKIEVLPRGFIDIVPNVLENGELVDKIIVNMHDYKNRTI